MRICFISYEYPPDTGFGGIATYIDQISQLFAARKISTEVICGSPIKSCTIQANEFLTITKIKCRNTSEFIKLSPGIASERHHQDPFDIIEVPEYGAEGLYVKDKLPEVPMAVKLHTPRFLIKELNDLYYDRLFFRRIKKKIGLAYKKEADPEYHAALKADFILSPSLSLKKIVAERWSLDEQKIIHAPNPYHPNLSLLNISSPGDVEKVLYIGRLETRKGVFNLAKAIPPIVRKFPKLKFVFVGKDSRGPMRERSMKKVILKEVGPAYTNIEFIDYVPLTSIPSYLANAGICVFPSLWENFPNVCLEAMSASSGIVASENGGMKDMLSDINGGLLVNPHDPSSIAQAVIEMVQNKKFRIDAGQRCREKIIGYYSSGLADQLITMYESSAGK